MENELILVRNVSVIYRKRKALFQHEFYEALRDVSFDVLRGETLGIIGKNGAGKSTLLKLLSGIYAPDKGYIVNKSVKTSLLTLRAGFDDNLSGRDNAILSGMLLGYPKEYVLSKLDDVEKYADIGEFFDEPIKTYSTGMKARLGFAVATYLTPEVLLIDEVLGVGDDRFREKAVATMKSMMRSDQTVVVVSHSAKTMSELCDRIIWIENGCVAVEGEPEVVLKAYHERS